MGSKSRALMSQAVCIFIDSLDFCLHCDLVEVERFMRLTRLAKQVGNSGTCGGDESPATAPLELLISLVISLHLGQADKHGAPQPSILGISVVSFSPSHRVPDSSISEPFESRRFLTKVY